MKKMKKIVALSLSIVLAFATCITSFAAEPTKSNIMPCDDLSQNYITYTTTEDDLFTFSSTFAITTTPVDESSPAYGIAPEARNTVVMFVPYTSKSEYWVDETFPCDIAFDPLYTAGVDYYYSRTPYVSGNPVQIFTPELINIIATKGAGVLVVGESASFTLFEMDGDYFMYFTNFSINDIIIE